MITKENTEVKKEIIPLKQYKSMYEKSKYKIKNIISTSINYQTILDDIMQDVYDTILENTPHDIIEIQQIKNIRIFRDGHIRNCTCNRIFKHNGTIFFYLERYIGGTTPEDSITTLIFIETGDNLVLFGNSLAKIATVTTKNTLTMEA